MPEVMGIGPVEAIPRALKLAGLQAQDIGLFELNEAFASQAIQVIRELGIDEEKVNVNGGAIALGHPLGCTGTKLTLSLIHEMKRRNEQFGVVTMCIGGMGRPVYLNYAKGEKQMAKKAAEVQKGGGFLIEDVTYDQMYTPEDFTDEHKMIAKTTEDFIEQDVLLI